MSDNLYEATGWLPDPATIENAQLLIEKHGVLNAKDANEFDWQAELGNVVSAPNTDLRHQSPAMMNQLERGTCVNQTAAGLYHSSLIRQGEKVGPHDILSRGFAHYLCLDERGLFGFDRGCWLRQSLRLIGQVGACLEKWFPYDGHDYWTRPPKRCFRYAADQSKAHARRMNRAPLEFRRILAEKGDARVQAFREALAQGHQIGFGVTVPKGFGRVDGFDALKLYAPSNDVEMGGGHAMRIVASITGGFIVANSWGSRWGELGHFYMANEWAAIARDPWILTSAPMFSDLQLAA